MKNDKKYELLTLLKDMIDYCPDVPDALYDIMDAPGTTIERYDYFDVDLRDIENAHMGLYMCKHENFDQRYTGVRSFAAISTDDTDIKRANQFFKFKSTKFPFGKNIDVLKRVAAKKDLNKEVIEDWPIVVIVPTPGHKLSLFTMKYDLNLFSIPGTVEVRIFNGKVIKVDWYDHKSITHYQTRLVDELRTYKAKGIKFNIKKELEKKLMTTKEFADYAKSVVNSKHKFSEVSRYVELCKDYLDRKKARKNWRVSDSYVSDAISELYSGMHYKSKELQEEIDKALSKNSRPTGIYLDNESIEKKEDTTAYFYRGYDSRHDPLDSENSYTWLTDNIEYAKKYAQEYGKYGKVAKVEIYCDDKDLTSHDNLNLYDNDDYLDLGDETFKNLVLDAGYRGYHFNLNHDDFKDVFCLCIHKSCVKVVDDDCTNEDDFTIAGNKPDYMVDRGKAIAMDIITNKRVNTEYFWDVLKAFKVHKGKVLVWGKTWTDPLEYYNEHLFARTMDDPKVSKYLKKKYYLTQEEFDHLTRYLICK